MDKKKFKIIDVHAHLSESISLQVGGSTKDLIKLMDENGIEKAVISPIPGYPDPEGVKSTAMQNDMIADAVVKYPDRFPCGLAALEPRHGEKALEELNRALGELKLKGLMFHMDYQGCEVDNPIMFRFMEEAKKYNPVILCHTAQLSHVETPYRFEKLAEAFPEIIFIAGHPAMDTTQLGNMLEVAKRNKNVLLDTCLWHHHLWPIKKAVDAIGGDRLLFGSDLPYYDRSGDIWIVENAKVSDEVKEKIFWKNAARVFDIKI